MTFRLRVASAVLLLLCSIHGKAGPVNRAAFEYPAAAAVAGEVPAAVAVDPQGHSFVAGTILVGEPGHQGQSVYIAKIDASGKNRIYTAHLDVPGAVWVKAVAVDHLGNVYVTGSTSSTNFPVIGGVQAAKLGGLDAFVAKLDSKGKTWLYSTCLGGSADDVAEAIAVDHDGNAYLTGWTRSSDFPLAHALQPAKAGETDAFVAKLNQQGRALLYSTYAGGGLQTAGHGIAVDESGAAYIVGEVQGRAVADGIVGAAALEKDGFLLKLSADGSQREFAASLEGVGTAVALDSARHAYVAGWSASSDGRVVFAAKYAPDGSRAYRMPIGNWAGSVGPAIAVDAAGSAYVSGTADAPGPRSRPQMIKLSADGARQLAASSIEALAGSQALALTVDPAGAAMIAGTRSTGLAYLGKVSTCSFRLAEALKHVGAEGETGAVAVEAAPDCAWTAGASASWVHVSPVAADDGMLHYTVDANPGRPRGASIAVAGQTLLIMQAGAATPMLGGYSGPIRTNPGFTTNQVTACDDCSGPQTPLGFSINFYGNPYTQVWVNNNGNLTFDSSLSEYSPNPIPQINSVMIAPYWADVDTRVGTLVTYGQDTVNGHPAFGANFVNVGYYYEHTDKLDSFQVVLISRSDLGAGYFDIEFNYSSIQWETGDASGGSGGLGGDSSRVGFTNGSNTTGTYYELPGSGINGAFLDGGPNALISNSANSGGVLGRYVYGVRGGNIVCAEGISPAAAGIVVGGGPLTVQVTASNSSCTWSVTGLPSWISLVSPSSGNGTGSGPVTLQVQAYSGTYRQATMSIAGQNYTVTQAGPDLAITKTHVPGWQPGDTGRTYTITVSNQGGTTSSGLVTVTDTLPAGLTATGISGTGWTCALNTLSCTRSDTVAALASFPVISIAVNVNANAPGSVTNTATVSGGGSVTSNNKTATDVTGIGPPDMTIAKSHSVTFHQGDTGDTYTIVATNSGGRATTAAVTVVDTLPTGLSATAIAGIGWTCTLGTATCTRSDALAPGASYPPITLTVNVASNAPSSVTNVATVSGGGETTTSNDTASDITTIASSGGGPYLLTVIVGSGTVTANPSSPNGYYSAGTVVTLTESPAAGYTFAGWSGGASGTGSQVSVTMNSAVSVTASFTPTSGTGGLGFYPMTPCRVVDTRLGSGKTTPFGGTGPLTRATATVFPLLSGSCNLPSRALAYSLTITAVPPSGLGYVTVWPTGQAQPTVSTLNALDGAITANAALVPAGTSGSISVYVSDPTDVIIDVNGYFSTPTSSALAFYPVTPCRIADTRTGSGKTGAFGSPSLAFDAERDIPVPASSCNIPSTAQAYSLNLTVLPVSKLTFLTSWPAGATMPIASTVNSSLGKVTAAAAIVPAGTSGPGSVAFFPSDNTDLIVDINGYFAPPGASGALYFYPVSPCRVADTRTGSGFSGAFGAPSVQFNTERDFPIRSSSCGLPSTAQAYSLNMTVVPQGQLIYLSTWAGAPQGLPVVSTLNSFDGRILANAAIVPAGSTGAIGVYVSNTSDVIIDVNGYFGQ